MLASDTRTEQSVSLGMCVCVWNMQRNYFLCHRQLVCVLADTRRSVSNGSLDNAAVAPHRQSWLSGFNAHHRDPHSQVGKTMEAVGLRPFPPQLPVSSLFLRYTCVSHVRPACCLIFRFLSARTNKMFVRARRSRSCAAGVYRQSDE